MKRYRLSFSEEAARHLLSIWQYLAELADPDVADSFVGLVRDRCRAMTTFPNRGTARDDLRQGLRTVPIPRRATVGYVVTSDEVVIVAIAYRGQDMAKLLTNAAAD